MVDQIDCTRILSSFTSGDELKWRFGLVWWRVGGMVSF